MLLLFFLRKDNMATNLEKLTWSYSSRRFVACFCWTQTSSQEMHQDSDCW